jgi:hypothetical protein
MRRCFGPRTFARGAGAWLLLLLALLATQAGFPAEGVFEGKVVTPPVDEPVPPGWIFVQGQNRLLRRVEVSHAVIVFGGQVPPSQRRKCGPECLEAGQEIRVTADQDSAGEWRAKRVEILRLTSHRT